MPTASCPQPVAGLAGAVLPDFAEEVLRSLIGGLGLVASAPITTALAATVVAGRRRDRRAPPLRLDTP